MAKSDAIQRPEKGTELFDTSEKVFPDVKAEPGESAYTFMHTVPYEGSVGLVNLLTTTRVQRKGFKTHLVLYGPGVLMASGSRGFPKVGDEAFPGHMAINNQLQDVHRRGRHRLRLPLRLRRALRLPGEPADGGRQAVPPARRARLRADRVARQGVPAQHLDRLSPMLVLDRDAAIDAWRRAEARVYPSVMVNAELYQQYIGVVRAVAEELRDVRTRGRPRRGLARAARAGARGRLALRAADARADGPQRGPRRRVLPSPPRAHARAGQGAGRRAAASAPAARAPSGSSCSRTSRRSARTGWRCTWHRAARCTRRPSCRWTRAGRSSRWRSSSSTRPTARGCWTSRR